MRIGERNQRRMKHNSHRHYVPNQINKFSLSYLLMFELGLLLHNLWRIACEQEGIYSIWMCEWPSLASWLGDIRVIKSIPKPQIYENLRLMKATALSFAKPLMRWKSWNGKPPQWRTCSQSGLLCWVANIIRDKINGMIWEWQKVGECPSNIGSCHC